MFGVSGWGNLVCRVLLLLMILVVKFLIGMVELLCFMSNLRCDVCGINVLLNMRLIWFGEVIIVFVVGVDCCSVVWVCVICRENCLVVIVRMSVKE